MKRFRFANRLIALLFTVVAGAGTVHAQGDPELSGLMQIAPPQVNSQLAIPYGYVDLTNGNLHLSIPYMTQAGPNGRSTTTSLNYNSRTWQEFVTASYTEFWTPTSDYGWVWRGWNDSRVTYRQTDIDIGYCNHDDDIEPHWDNIAYSDNTGVHVFPIDFTRNCNSIGSSAGGVYASDNSGYYGYFTTDVNGDPRGETMKVWSPNGALVYNGTLSSPSAMAVDSNGSALDALSSSASPPSSATTTETEYMYVPASALTMGGVSEINSSSSNVKTLTLPDGRSFSMTYDVCPNGQSCTDKHLGTLKNLTLPTGGTLTFGYDTFTTPDSSDSTAAEIRVTSVSLSGETAGNCGSTSGTTWALCWHSTAPAYARYFTGVDVTEPAGTNGSRSLSTRDLTSYFSGGSSQNWYVSDLKTYAGSSASGTPLEEVAYSGFNGTFPTDISTYHDGALISKTHYTLWDPMLPMISSVQQQDASGNVLRETKYTFLPPVGTNLHPGTPTVHYIDRPQTMLVYGDGGSSGTAVAGLNFYYDGPISATSGFNNHSVTGLSWHDDANFGSGMTSRGNLTSVSRMSAGGGYVTTNTMSYNMLGQLVSSTDGNGNTTQHDWYSDSFGDATCASSSQFFFDTAIKNAKNQVSRTIYDSCTGTVHAQKSANDVAANRNGTVFGYDAGGRLTSTTLPDGGSTGVQYTDGGNSSVTTTVQVASGKTTQSITHLDSFGRTSQTEQVVADVDGGNVKTDVTVDLSGAPATVHGPYATNRPGGTTTYVYDALHRTTSTSRQGITQSQVTYSGLTTTTQDGRGNSTVTTNNLLGQLVSTKEAGNQLTEYGYDFLGNLNTVTQHGNGSETAVVRSFSYDPLSRLVQAYNPESGWTCYGSLSSGSKPNGVNCPGDASHTGYDGNNNLVQKTDARGVVTYFGYDPLNRLKSRGTGASSAINSCYLYDTDTATNPAESVGLLVAEWTQLGSCDSNATTVPNSSVVKTVHKIGAYDQVGRVLSESNCVMGSCSAARGQTYGYNLDGSLKNAGNGMGSSNALTMGYDSAGRLSSYSATAFGSQANLGFRYGPVRWTWGSMGRSIFLERNFDLFNRVTGMTAKPVE